MKSATYRQGGPNMMLRNAGGQLKGYSREIKKK